MSTVYLLHFDRPYPAGRRPQHYVGVAADVDKRVAEHRNGNPGKGGSLTRAIKKAGIGFRVAEEWHFATADEAFEFERVLKRRRRHKAHCKFCKEVAFAKFERAALEALGAWGKTRQAKRSEARRCRRRK